MTDEPVSIPQGISFGIGVFRGRERDDYIIFPRISLLLLMKLVILSGVRVP